MSKPEKQQEEHKDKKDRRTADRMRAYAKYSGMAFQMGAIILVGTLAGQWLDDYFGLERPLLTVLMALISIFAALYLVLKDLFVQNDDS